MPIQVRLRAPSGQSRLELDDTTTYAQFLDLVKEKTGLTKFTLKYGYPLKDLRPGPEESETTVKDLKLHGETIVVASLESAEPTAPPPAPEKPKFEPKGVEPDETVVKWPQRGGYVVLRVMPDDNSCMFTAVGGALGIDDPSRVLRQQVVDYILSNPVEYPKVVLGDEPARYTARMKQLDTWGGAIELSILSKIYDIEISSIDVKSLRVDRFGEDKELRCIILYSGIHYDRIAFTMDLTHPVEVDVTKWSADDDEALDKARELAGKLNNLHYYTDTTDFVIKCEICNWIGQGTKEAAEHEKKTGHGQFGEMEIQ
ncbi:OTU-domain-containing protein [Thozetella sp. PMI_491]|nr:OTU-domain-containing protein [Thozetella sp. PMI_491]